MESDSPVVLWQAGSILRHPDIAQQNRKKRLGGFGVHCELRGVFGKRVERPILQENDHMILAVVLSMARQEEVKRSRMLAEASGNILIDTKWNTSK